MNHHSAECARRIPIRTWVPSYPDWRAPRARWLDDLASAGPVLDDDADDENPCAPGPDEPEPARSGPIVRCRPLTDGDPIPPAAGRLWARVRALMPAELTYAKGWGRRKMPIPADDGVRHFEPWPVESVVLRCRALALPWMRKEGEGSWKADSGYAVWSGRIWPVKVTQAEALIRMLEEGRKA